MATETRFVVRWTPWSDVKAAARRAGWVDGDEHTSPSDHVDVHSFGRRREFHIFSQAVTFARSVADDDAWACPHIDREALTTHDTDDRGRKVRAVQTWDREATWEVFAEEPDPTEDNPDELYSEAI
jgi:hypothetical protein